MTPGVPEHKRSRIWWYDDDQDKWVLLHISTPFRFRYAQNLWHTAQPGACDHDPALQLLLAWSIRLCKVVRTCIRPIVLGELMAFSAIYGTRKLHLQAHTRTSADSTSREAALHLMSERPASGETNSQAVWASLWFMRVHPAVSTLCWTLGHRTNDVTVPFLRTSACIDFCHTCPPWD